MDNESENKISVLNLKRYLIYFLWEGDSVVYVGQSKNGISRIINHIDEKIKNFDAYSFINCESFNLDELEAEFIIKHRPRYNLTIPANIKFSSIYCFLKLLGIEAKLINEFKLKFQNKILFLDYVENTAELKNEFLEFYKTFEKKEVPKSEIINPRTALRNKIRKSAEDCEKRKLFRLKCLKNKEDRKLEKYAKSFFTVSSS